MPIGKIEVMLLLDRLRVMRSGRPETGELTQVEVVDLVEGQVDRPEVDEGGQRGVDLLHPGVVLAVSAPGQARVDVPLAV